MRALVRSAVLIFAAVAAGCDRAPPEPLFPLEAGRAWHYRVQTVFDGGQPDDQVDRFVIRADGRDDVGGAPAWRRTSSLGNAWWLRSDASGVFRVATISPLDLVPQLDPQARYVLKRPYVVGTAWQGETTAYVLQRKNEVPRELRHLPRYRVLPIQYRIGATDQVVRTPAGVFEGCVRVDGRAEIRLHVDEVFAYRDVPLFTREWYCPGAGLVKLERDEKSPTKFIVGGEVTMELIRYE